MFSVPQQRRTIFTPEIKEIGVQGNPLLEYVVYNLEVTVSFIFEQTFIISIALPRSWETCVSHSNKSNGLTTGKKTESYISHDATSWHLPLPGK